MPSNNLQNGYLPLFDLSTLQKYQKHPFTLRLQAAVATLYRRGRSRPISSFFLILFTWTIIGWLILKGLMYGENGRWYWNYLVTFHPAMAHIIPSGKWGPPENPPRWLDEIHDARWMGNCPIPELTPPTYSSKVSSTQRSSLEIQTGNGIVPVNNHHLTNPVIVKLHVFSDAVRDKSYHKRQVIRECSPLWSLPIEYRHLVEVKFVIGHKYNPDWSRNDTMEDLVDAEQAKYGDLLRLDGLWHGENLREGKILDWIRAVGDGKDGGREAWYLFKVDDDTVMNTPNLLELLLSLNPATPTYLGTSLARWPPYHFHYTGLLTGVSWGVVKTLSEGIGKMSESDRQFPWDDDVLTGELMMILPSAPHCHPSPNRSLASLPDYCDPHWVHPYGYASSPPSPDPRTNLLWYDFIRRAGNTGIWWIEGDLARHGYDLKMPNGYTKEWRSRVKGQIWDPTDRMKELADPRLM